MSATTKDEAKELIDRLPDEASWEELAYAIEFRAAVERGRRDVREGRVSSTADVLAAMTRP